ncbi:U6 snRNA-associated Sm-like protein LSm1 [Xenia sp. Carnegie-2017]|uniref:U6 snRNA-associated Sm-like protein LSm1 n=1 Tax=Xenia sp. Carnegie-2017 TaxID=2897299 RepID=UPI001F040D2F|nr:U6 snRNA-associated Sm-like protein LSm1 [Xenia sp. Carnegie-2017]
MSFLPGTASLIKEINKELLVVLRDGRTLIGCLKSIDQYANLLLQDTIERIQVGKKYGDIYRGIFLIRGENVVLVGEFDGSADEKTQMIKVDVEEILEAQRSDQIAKDEHERALVKARLQLGMHVNLPDSYIVSKDDFGT